MDVTSNNFNDLGLIPLPSNIEAIESKLQLNEVLYIDFDKQDQSLKKIVKYFAKKSNTLGFQIKDGNNNTSSLICFKIDKSLSLLIQSRAISNTLSCSSSTFFLLFFSNLF